MGVGKRPQERVYGEFDKPHAWGSAWRHSKRNAQLPMTFSGSELLDRHLWRGVQGQGCVVIHEVPERERHFGTTAAASAAPTAGCTWRLEPD